MRLDEIRLERTIQNVVPYSQFRISYRWCPGEDLNLHGLLHKNLNLARLPITPPGQRENYKRKWFRPPLLPAPLRRPPPKLCLRLELLPRPAPRRPDASHRSLGGACARRGAGGGPPWPPSRG